MDELELAAIGLACMMPACDRARPADWAICASCQRLLPQKHRYAIARAFIRDMTWETATVGMRKAIAAAYAWLVKTFGSEDKGGVDPTRWERLKRFVRAKDEARAAARAEALAAGVPVKHKLRLMPRCPSPECPCSECVVEYGMPT